MANRKLANVSTRELTQELVERKRIANYRRRQAAFRRRKYANEGGGPVRFYTQYENAEFDTDEEAYEDFIEVMSQYPSFKPLGLTSGLSPNGKAMRFDFEADPQDIYQFTLDTGAEFAQFADTDELIDYYAAKRALSGGTTSNGNFSYY